MISEEIGHLGRRDADEADLRAASAHPIGPGRFVLVVDQRRQHERHVPVDGIAASRPLDLVPRAREDGRDVGHVDARHIVILLFHVRNDRGHPRKRVEPRPVAADDGVLADEPAVRFQVCENDSHRSPHSDEAKNG